MHGGPTLIIKPIDHPMILPLMGFVGLKWGVLT
jgi:hypothetical protein